jgi:hypothetical protein
MDYGNAIRAMFTALTNGKSLIRFHNLCPLYRNDEQFTVSNERGPVMLYFVKESTLHRYPVPLRCNAKFGNEIIRDTIPHGVQQCEYCLKWWPGDTQHD